MAEAPNQLLTSLLRDVSRSFYLTLRVLPSAIRPQIGLAYLLARTTDTIADTELVPVASRLTALQALRDRIRGQRQQPLDFGDLAPRQDSAAERLLLLRCEDSLSLLGSLSETDQILVKEVLETITSGQELDLLRFGAASRERIVALQSADELDDYTYRVAGCVGEFWTRMCQAHVFPAAWSSATATGAAEQNKDSTRGQSLLDLGVRFGKGLQLVNVLRDIPADLRRGRCYLPADQLAPLGLKPADLLDPTNAERARPVYDLWLQRALDHLRAGWAYTNALPSGLLRVRLACAWPVLIGFETLELLKTGNFLDPAAPRKVTRRRVRQILARSVILLPWPSRWRRLAPIV